MKVKHKCVLTFKDIPSFIFEVQYFLNGKSWKTISSTFLGMEPLLDYFQTVYVVGRLIAQANPAGGINLNIGVRREPLFPPETWNVHTATLNHQDRTNNQTEGWNHR